MKIVIIGNGKIGSNLAALLVQEGHDITVVDCDETHLRKSQNTLDVMCIEGNGATAETQLEAGADKATLLTRRPSRATESRPSRRNICGH